MNRTVEALTEDGGPRLVALVGDSGTGKTTAASNIVRSTEVRQAFRDGIVWLPVNKGAKQRLPSLMRKLAHMVYECTEGSVGQFPAISDEGAAYIRQRMSEDHFRKRLKCLVVADNVWEEEVVLKLRETGMWVLLSTRDTELVKSEQGEAVGVNELSMADAKSVLRRAAELPPEANLSDDAIDLITLCGHVAMDLAFVGRWSTVRGRQDRKAWSDTADKIRTAVDKVQAEYETDGVESEHAKRRKAILLAGFEDLAVGSDDVRVPRLYLSLAVMPDGHYFTLKDAAVLLYNTAPSAEDVESVVKVLETLERWTIVRSAQASYHMHEAHSRFARETLIDRVDVRRPALERWTRFISSLGALRSIDAFVLKELWLGLKRAGGDGWDEYCPYVEALDLMAESDPLLRQSIEAMGDFQRATGDWEAASNTWRRLLEVENKELGPNHSFVLNTFQSLADCAAQLGHTTEAVDWRRRGREALPLVLARMQLLLDVDSKEEVGDACGLHDVGVHVSRWAPDHRGREEILLRAYLVTQETKLGREDVKVAHTLHSLSACLRYTGRLEEAEGLLRRCLVIREDKLGREDTQVANTLCTLSICVREAGRLEEAEELLRRCLVIEEGKLGRENIQVSNTLHSLGVCARMAGRLEEAERLLTRSLVMKEAALGREHVQVAYTLHELAVCVRNSGRLEEAEEVFRRCLGIKETNLGREDMQVAVTLHELGVCIRDAGRLEEAEKLLKLSMMIKEVNRGADDVEVAITMRELGVCIRDVGRLGAAEKLLRRCLAIEETKLGQQTMEVANTLHELGVCVRYAGRLEEAEDLLRCCLVIEEATLGLEDARVAITLYSLGVCVREAGRLEEAKGLLRRCLAIEEADLDPNDLQVAITLHELGVCVRMTGQKDEAENLLRRCLVIEEATLGPADMGVAITLYELGVCIRDAGRLEEADKLIRRARATIRVARFGQINYD